MSKEKVAESLAEKLQEYAYEVEIGEHQTYYDDYIVDDLLEMREILFQDDVEAGVRYHSYFLVTDTNVKLYDLLNVNSALSDSPSKIKVMSIDNVKLLPYGKISVEILGAKINQ